MKRTALIFIAVVGFCVWGTFAAKPAAAACKETETTIQIISRDVDGALLPGLNYIVYEQRTNPDGNPYFGTKLRSGVTDAGGQSALCTTSDGPYAVNFYEYNASYGNRVLWNDQLAVSGQTVTAEVRLSFLRVIVRDGDGKLLKNISYDIYVQAYDVDGSPIVDESAIQKAKLVSDKYNTGADGDEVSLLGAGKYVVRIHGTGSSYFYLWEQNVTNTAATTLEYRLSTLRVELEDGLGSLIKNRTFDLYEQEYDARDQPIFGTLVSSGLSVGTTGKFDAYVPAGKYALKIPGSTSGMTYSSWAIQVNTETVTTREYRLAGLRIILKENDKLAKNVKFDIWLQEVDAVGAPALKQRIISSTTGELGYSDMYLTPGKYALIYGQNRVYNLDVFENRFTVVDWPNVVTVRRQEMTLSYPIVNRLTLKGIKDAVVRGVAKFKARISKTYRVDAQRLSKPYTVVLSYSASALRDRGIDPAKLRIAYYNAKTKKWSLIGRNNTKLQQATAQVSSEGNFVLVATK